ncbi:hypothetical protein [Agarivorans sp. Alg241-V36]|uniref:hypothetical protein n=1 Tax=Agarivorans sp. Alg241-V36 TaxID=2305992 RepID=UPI0013D70417|nr:hypothetical protein [Agarivorans sp. Alg241-V36]
MNKYYLVFLSLFVSASSLANIDEFSQHWHVANNNNAAVLSQDQGYLAEFSFTDGGVIISSTVSGNCTKAEQQHTVAGKLVTFKSKHQKNHCLLVPKSLKDKAIVNSSFNRMHKVSFNNATFTTAGFHDALIEAEKIRFTGKRS